jgi:sulfide dehydrogenase cytochrome subunit
MTGIRLTAIAALLAVAGPTWAVDAGVLKMCVGCHGEDGVGVDADTPIIAGVPAITQEDAIYAYIDGDRTCDVKPFMCMAVSKLSEEQVTELAEHFAAMPHAPAGEEVDPALAEKGKALSDAGCAICHGADEPNTEYGILHGQRKNYLRYTLKHYAAGTRTQLPAMEKQTSALSEDDIEALVNFYASFKN